MAKIDQYNLKASTPSPISGNQELDKNLSLSVSLISNAGIVQGKVTTGTPAVDLADATVTVFSSSSGLPLYSANTNSNGFYNIPDVVAGSYFITATKQGYLTPIASSINVATNRPTERNISLVVDPSASLNTLYGKVRTAGTSPAPIDSATVTISQVVDGEKNIVATTFTNTDGQYLLPDLPAGQYVVDAFKANYLSPESSQITLTNSQKAPLNISLTPLATAQFGTVSGFISSQTTGLPIANAVVGLYQIVGTEEILVQQTRTNTAGRYLFGSVADGTLVVKAIAQTDAPQ
jgi:5-hydroxyisourate hydrolase-like protein (transthyretin family)